MSECGNCGKENHNGCDICSDCEEQMRLEEQQQISEQLKPCPFCGGEAIKDKIFATVFCPKCDLVSDLVYWNVRPIEDALTARLEEAEKVIGVIGKALIDYYTGSYSAIELQAAPDAYHQWKEKKK